MGLNINDHAFTLHNKMELLRTNITTFSMLSMLYISKPIYLSISGGGVVLTAVYLINHLPTPLLSNKSPFELLYHRLPTLDHLRIFGCLCYATMTHPIQKFDARATPCIFVGYPMGQKGYKLLICTAPNFLSIKMFNSMNIFFISPLSHLNLNLLRPLMFFLTQFLTFPNHLL
ncbi:unnamed protein product [Prunus brigantina]